MIYWPTSEQIKVKRLKKRMRLPKGARLANRLRQNFAPDIISTTFNKISLEAHSCHYACCFPLLALKALDIVEAVSLIEASSYPSCASSFCIFKL